MEGSSLERYENIFYGIFFIREDYSDIHFERCKNGSLTYKINDADKNVYAHSKYNPEAEAEKFAESVEFKRDTIFVIFGFGLGHYVRALIKRKEKNNFKRNIFIIYEPNTALFSKIVDEGVCNDILENERVFVVADNNINYYSTFLRENVDEGMYFRCQVMAIPSYEKAYKDMYTKFLLISKKRFIDNIINRNTLLYNAKLWTNNYFFNTKNILNSYYFMQFKDVFKGGTAIVVAAGPSLKKNIHLLKEVKGKIPIIAVFVAVKVLLENGIVPDFMVSVDALQKGMKKGVYDDIPLIYDSRISREFINSHKGIKICHINDGNTYMISIFDKFKKEKILCESGGTVAFDCLFSAFIMGCKNIILIGQDFAYTDNKRHVDGTEHGGENEIEIESDYFEVPAVGGGTVFTDPVFAFYIEWFEKFAFEHQEINIVDATEGGALIKYTEVITLREAIDKYNMNMDAAALIKARIDKGMFFSDDEKNAIIAELNSEVDLIDSVLDIINEEDELFDKYIKLLGCRSNIDAIIKIEDELDKFDEKIKAEKEKIPLILGLSEYILRANECLTRALRISNEDPVMESANIRKKELLDFKDSLLYVQKLRNENPL